MPLRILLADGSVRDCRREAAEDDVFLEPADDGFEDAHARPQQRFGAGHGSAQLSRALKHNRFDAVHE